MTVKTFSAPGCITNSDDTLNISKFNAVIHYLNSHAGFGGGWSGEIAGMWAEAGFEDCPQAQVTVRSNIVNTRECFRNACYALFQPSAGQP